MKDGAHPQLRMDGDGAVMILHRALDCRTFIGLKNLLSLSFGHDVPLSNISSSATQGLATLVLLSMIERPVNTDTPEHAASSLMTAGKRDPAENTVYAWQRWPRWLKLMLFPIAYFCAAELGTYLTFKPHEFLSIWLPSGIFLAALLGSSKRDWPWFFVLVFPASIAFNSLEGKSWQISCLFTLVNCIESFSAALLLRKFVGPFPQLRSIRELALIVLLGGILCTAMGGILAASVISLLGGANQFWENWALWTGAVSLGVILLTPLLLAWLGSEKDTMDWRRPAWQLEAILLLTCLVGSTLLGFTHFWRQGLSMEYLPLPFLIWAAFRFGLKGVTLANGVVCLLAAWLTVRSFDELQGGAFSPYLCVAQFQLLLVVIVFMGLIPSVMMVTLRLSEERRRR